jgi:3-oxoadipate enol-lactonase
VFDDAAGSGTEGAHFITVPDGQLYCEVQGAGRPIVLLHAGVTDCRMWDDALGRLAPAFRVVRYDQRGSGQSSPPTTPYADHEDLAALLRAIGLKSATLVGVSGGGAIALDLAQVYPELVDALVVISSGLSGYSWSETLRPKMAPIGEAATRGDFAAAAEARVRVWTDGPSRTPNQVDPGVRRQLARMHLDAFRRSEQEQARGLPDPDALQQFPDPPTIERLAAITAPTLIMVGGQDEPDIRAIAHRLYSGIAGAHLREFPELGHMLVLERPALVLAEVQEFIATHQRQL